MSPRERQRTRRLADDVRSEMRPGGSPIDEATTNGIMLTLTYEEGVKLTNEILRNIELRLIAVEKLLGLAP